jgi:hypothetical protein
MTDSEYDVVGMLQPSCAQAMRINCNRGQHGEQFAQFKEPFLKDARAAGG